MAARLAGKVAIVTGAGSSGPGIGTGKAISTLFAREGAKVLLADKNVGLPKKRWPASGKTRAMPSSSREM